MRWTRKEEQISEIQSAVCVAIEQAAELSGLRNWFIFNVLRQTKPGECPNSEMIVQSIGRDLIVAFQNMIDGDDRQFFESPFYLQCDTELGIFQVHKLPRPKPTT